VHAISVSSLGLHNHCITRIAVHTKDTTHDVHVNTKPGFLEVIIPKQLDYKRLREYCFDRLKIGLNDSQGSPQKKLFVKRKVINQGCNKNFVHDNSCCRSCDMNFARQKSSGPFVNWGQQSGSSIYSNGLNPYQKGGDQKGRGGTCSSGTDQYQRGSNYGGMRTMAKGSAKEVKGSKVVHGLQPYQLRYNY